MPTRLIRDGFLTSQRVDQLSWAEECFYHRLLLAVDDYGRFYADPFLIFGKIMPRKIGRVSNSDIDKWLTACVAAGLVRVYAVDGKQYLEVDQFGQRTRSASKFPAFAGDVSDGCLSVADRCPPYAETETETKADISSGCHCVEQFPRSSEDVRLFMAAQLMAPKGEELARCAESFFDDFSARGWRDSKGIPLVSWQPAARKYARSWATNNVQQGRKGPVARKDANEGRRFV